MKIFNVEIQNYRQYRGTISTAISTDNKKNISMLLGDNGEGKSNFVNAIAWCLFEDEMFKSKKNEGRPIINEKTFTAAKPGETVETSVTVTLGESKPKYEFKRKMLFTKTQEIQDDIVRVCQAFCQGGKSGTVLSVQAVGGIVQVGIGQDGQGGKGGCGEGDDQNQEQAESAFHGNLRGR